MHAAFNFERGQAKRVVDLRSLIGRIIKQPQVAVGVLVWILDPGYIEQPGEKLVLEFSHFGSEFSRMEYRIVVLAISEA